MSEQKADFRKLIEVLRRVGNGFTAQDLGKLFAQYHDKYHPVLVSVKKFDVSDIFNGEI